MPKTDTVLTRMPRDCTEQGSLCGDEQSSIRQLHPILDMNNNKQRKSLQLRKSPARGRSSNPSSAIGRPISMVGTAYNTQVSSSQPRFYPTRDGMRVVHREYVGDVGVNASGFGIVNILQLNPGLLSCGQWLSQIAGNFECYEFHKLRYVYQAAVPTSTAGTLFMAIDYDAADPAPATKTELMSNPSAISCSIWASTQLDYDCSKTKYMSNRFTRISSVSGDIKTYDAGNLYFAIEGAMGTSPGNIYVEYDISLRLPQIPSNLEFAQSLKITNAGTAALSNLNDGYNGNTLILNSLLGTPTTGNWVCPTPGEYLLSFAIGGTAAGAVTPVWSITSGSASITDIGYAAVSATANVGIYEAILLVADAGAVVQLALAALSTIVNSQMRVAKYGYSLV